MVASAAAAAVAAAPILPAHVAESAHFTVETLTALAAEILTGFTVEILTALTTFITTITTMISSFLAASRSGAGAILTGVILIRTLTVITRTAAATTVVATVAVTMVVATVVATVGVTMAVAVTRPIQVSPTSSDNFPVPAITMATSMASWVRGRDRRCALTETTTAEANVASASSRCSIGGTSLSRPTNLEPAELQMGRDKLVPPFQALPNRLVSASQPAGGQGGNDSEWQVNEQKVKGEGQALVEREQTSSTHRRKNQIKR